MVGVYVLLVLTCVVRPASEYHPTNSYPVFAVAVNVAVVVADGLFHLAPRLLAVVGVTVAVPPPETPTEAVAEK